MLPVGYELKGKPGLSRPSPESVITMGAAVDIRASAQNFNMNRKTFLRTLLGLPFAAKVAVALSDHADLVARVDKSIIDETRKRLGMEKVIMVSNPTGWGSAHLYERWRSEHIDPPNKYLWFVDWQDIEVGAPRTYTGPEVSS